MTRALLRIASLLLVAGTSWAQSTVELIDAGAAPRAPLRYQYQAGTTERVTSEMAISMAQEVNGQLTPAMAMPPTRTVMETRITDVAADGSAQVEMRTVSAEAAPGPTSTGDARPTDSLVTMSRLAGRYRVDALGRTLQADVSLTPATGPEPDRPSTDRLLTEINGVSTNQASMFPDQAVGTGARWRVTTTQAFMGVNMQMTQEYTLRSRKGDIVELDMKMSGPVLDTGSAALAGAPAGIQQVANASGTATVDLRRLNPRMSMQVDNEVSQGTVGQPGASRMKMQMRMTLTPEVL